MSSNIQMILQQGFEDFREFVNPLIALRTELTGEPSQIRSIQNAKLIDLNQSKIEDFHGTQAFGHRNPYITAAVQEFLASDSPSWFPSRVNPYAGYLAKRLCKRASKTCFYDNVFFASSGSEAVEASMKLARAVTRRPRILSLEGAYHGCTFGSCSLMHKGPYYDPFSPHLPGTERLPFGDISALKQAFLANDVAAVVVEPIQVEGGVRALAKDYIKTLGELCHTHQTIFVADEVQTGLGRTGRFLASETWPIRPDVVLLGKHLGGGLLPISAMLTKKELFEKAYGHDFESSEAHNSTFSGNAMVCVAALATLELLTDELITNVASLGKQFRDMLNNALSDLPLFEEIRGEGLTIGIHLQQIDHPWLSFEHFGMNELSTHPTTGLLLCHRLYKRGFFCFVCGHDWKTLRIQPRFTIEHSVLEEFTKAVQDELSYLSDLI